MQISSGTSLDYTCFDLSPPIFGINVNGGNQTKIFDSKGFTRQSVHFVGVTWKNCASRGRPHCVAALGRESQACQFLVENDGFSVAVEQNPVVDVPTDGAGQDDLLEVASLLDEVFDRISVGDADDVLLDDGTVVEYLGNVVAGRADEFDASLEGLVVGFRAYEGGQERMVNVDDTVGKRGHEFVGEHLHVAGEYGEVCVMLADEGDLLLLGDVLVFFRDGDDNEGNAIEVGDGLVIGVIGNDQGDIAVEFADLVAVEQVDKTVVIPRNHDHHSLALARLGEAPFHGEAVSCGGELAGEFRERDIKARRIEFDAHEEPLGVCVGVLVGVKDVAAVPEDEVGDGSDQTLLVGATDE